ncbi:unnamed protein product [Brugia timori]|uniref:Uncharacterized protein n=1 Tax=Brugia timori TaxID=42155 RepID=A0A0R3R841_9BILA|nr:unnamed protein product [Brugia timori]
METSTTIVHEASSAFDPDREMKDRKLAQIFKKLHMEQVCWLPFHFSVARSKSLNSLILSRDGRYSCNTLIFIYCCNS